MRAPAILIAATCAALALGAFAQDNKPSKEREALRRAQTALRSAQEQQATLQADKARAESAAQAATQSAERARHQAASQATRLKALEAELTTLQSQSREHQQALAATQATLATTQASERELQRRLALATDTGNARLQTAQTLTGLLERSTQALADAEAKNHRLHGIAQNLVQLYTSRSPLDTALLNDRMFGLSAVRLEDQAEQIRSQLSQHRIPTRPGD